MVEMQLVEIQNSYVQNDGNHLILKEREGGRCIPIYVGWNESGTARDAVFKVVSPRPLTHDLVLNVIDGLNASLEGVVVDSLDRGIFHGKLIVRTSKGQHVKIDARPSDAIILAVKLGVPIYAAEEVLEQVDPAEDF